MNKIAGSFKRKDVVSVEQFEKEDMYILFSETDRMKKLVERQGGDDFLRNKVMAALFYEPSSRTFGSFTVAMQRLGGTVIPMQAMKYSSVAKGETLEDTIRIFSCYSDVIVLRHSKMGAAVIAAEVSSVSLINAGDGSREHPTQALLDLYTIASKFNLKEKITVAMVGDLRFGRTVHSLSKLLANFPRVKQLFVSPDLLRIPKYIKKYIEKFKIEYEETKDLKEALSEADVLYMTRVQKERFDDMNEYNKVNNLYILDNQTIKLAKENMIVMHPLPRINEIAYEIDSDRRSVYLREQIRNGLYIRMALLKLILT